MTVQPLAARFRDHRSTFDALVPADLLVDELTQREESGYDLTGVRAEVEAVDLGDRDAVLALLDRLSDLPRRPDWAHDEPDALEAIEAAAAGATARPYDRAGAAYAERLHAAWLGRIAGCNIGKPVEDGDHWTPAHLRDYLERADAYPLADYVPALEPMPEGFLFRDNWPETTRGRVNGSARDDDIDYAILALHLLETHGAGYTTEQVGAAWLRLFPVLQTYTAERAAYLNLTDGVPVPATASYRNPYREWIGAQIRADVFGWVHPGDPTAAARLAYPDARLSHTGNGIYGELWSAALNAAAFVAADAAEALEIALGVVPERSRLHDVLTGVTALHERGLDWEQALEALHAEHGHYAWIHTLNNAAAVAAALLWSEDWMGAVGKVVMSGWDTDSNGATVGSVAGVLYGREGLPAHVVDPLHDRTRSALFGFDHSVISDLADRTVAVARRIG
ncbi:ADP-ribosylglycohydrolase [Friedmanniella endophytica]|uniref:ADP-ribosylglycohydrolase n=1 Tax=Microlunatus kandeliicorticis TaxID=1759536 RepID=A0A7W3P5S4_9ACTN|nr:ADP-ribosylglycohydrolase family protein [Microlunatus kandeliicorticis]MBA8794279.1 ADP-ribosylglycohydrolase [Microlunatus kandeliicorticis]